MKYSNGDVYEGVFEYDLRSKTGRMTYKDGSVYDGCWNNGLVTRRVTSLTIDFVSLVDFVLSRHVATLILN